jgi:hypothetical protein
MSLDDSAVTIRGMGLNLDAWTVIYTKVLNDLTKKIIRNSISTPDNW